MFEILRHISSICAVKSVICLIKTFKMGAGTNFPGKIACKISPRLLSCLTKQTKKEIITITGTNGKTTTAGLAASVFETFDRKVVHNKEGANMLTGIITAVAENSSLNGKLKADNCIFETDEAYMSLVFDNFNPDIVLVTNLFRDQLDRYGELNTTARKIEAAIEKTIQKKPLKLLLNADDPMVSRIMEDSAGENLATVFYGFDEIEYLNQIEKTYSPLESVNCKCGEAFGYTKIFYGHLGYYECSGCGAKRPSTKVSAKAYIDIARSRLVINDKFEVRVDLPGLYNCYNALAAITAGMEAGIPPETIKKGIENYSTIFGRSESLNINGKDTLIQLIKNPIGASEVLKTIRNDDKGKLFIVINDNYADGRDVSWLWDANFEMLSTHGKTTVISGSRAFDMAVRLKYAGIDSKNLIVTENVKKALGEALKGVEVDERLYILPTYTSLLELEKIKQSPEFIIK